MASERIYLGDREGPQDAVHLARYNFALDKIAPGDVVLDAACGSGYGSEILSRKADRVIGLDLSVDAINYARAHYQNSKTEFSVADLTRPIKLPDRSCDTIVCFETLEHVVDQRNMFVEFARLLKKGGLFIVSTPDRQVITDKAHDHNEFHVAELSKRQFENLVGDYFQLLEFYGQVRYTESPTQVILKTLACVDVLNLRRLAFRSWRLTAILDRVIGPKSVELEGTSVNSPANHYYLVAVAVNSRVLNR
jgi:ubiquinone/menaquinone biosynthesis C-methylase UbiE